MNQAENQLKFGSQSLSLQALAKAASRHTRCELEADKKFVEKIDKGADFLQQLLQEEGSIYGVTTGFGDSCDVAVSRELALQMPKNLYTFHGCGSGRFLSKQQARLVIAVRLLSLCQGVSGVRYRLLEQLMLLLQHDIVPLIPEEGSVGASGDLTPLSYLAAVLCGERQVYFNGEICQAADALQQCGIEPLQLMPKEGLAIMNGTAVMTALSIEAYLRADYLSRLCSRITALITVALGSNVEHFADFLFQVKPHQGQIKAAARIRADLAASGDLFTSKRLQERYSVRCAPHIIGVLEDMLPTYLQTIENEMNSANDNPIIDGEKQQIYHGGHFYGGHIAFVMDAMKNNVANLADLLDRQMALLVDVKFNHGLPRNLSGAKAAVAAINHGFKAVQIACSAWTAEALKLTMPASVFSRSTESHNQDKVSMGTIAARDCLRVLQLTEQVAAAVLMAAVQGIWLRVQQNELKPSALSPSLQGFIEQIRQQSEPLREDRCLDTEIKQFSEAIKNKQWSLYE